MCPDKADEADLTKSAEPARDALADVRDVVADARETLLDAREERADAADRHRDDRDSLANERDRLSDERDQMADLADAARDEDALQAAAPDVSATAQQGTLPTFKLVVAELLAAGIERDTLANRRDIAANRRDMQAKLHALIADVQEEAYFEALTFARRDRDASRLDRMASAVDRTTLSTPIGDVQLPASIPTQRDPRTPLGDCTPAEVSTYCEELLAESLIQLSEAIEIVEHDGAATSDAKQLLEGFKQHHETATDLIWYVGEWLATGSQPQVHAI